MKVTIALLSAVISYTSAQPHAGLHKHQHAHLHQRQAPDATGVAVAAETQVMYELDGYQISKHDAEEGIHNGTLVWADGAPGEPIPSPNAVPTTTSADNTPPAYSTPASSPESSPAPEQPSSGSGSGWSGSSSGVDSPFPDGELDCSEFPSDYGAVALDWLGLGGWSGIQSPGSTDGGYSNIMTKTSSTCGGGNCCNEGDFCSYACPAGYQKTQWPTQQGATGQSIGGIQCQGGKLHLTNTAMSTSLCMQGAQEVQVQVQNNLGQGVSVCRTDYPGTESETIPLWTDAGASNPITMPDANNYYDWEGSHTSAQYYVNPAGVSVQDACQWGSSANPWGNWAPLNLGVGYSNGAAWLSIFQNAPTTSASLDFSVEIQGDGMSGTCRYSNGQYCGGPDYSDCSSTTGCTVSMTSGTATFVFSN